MPRLALACRTQATAPSASPPSVSTESCSPRTPQAITLAAAGITANRIEAAHANTEVANLPLRWFGIDGAPCDKIVLFTPPCALRHQALASPTDREHEVVEECSDLTTVLSAARNGVGVTPLPRTGPLPDGLRHVPNLPAIPDATLYAATSSRVDAATRSAMVGALRARLHTGLAGA